MKLKMTRKQMAIAVLLIIIVPIIYNKVSGVFAGLMMQQMMKIPKEVVVDTPHYEDSFVTAESTGRVEAKYSVDVIARVSGFLLKKYFKEASCRVMCNCREMSCARSHQALVRAAHWLRLGCCKDHE